MARTRNVGGLALLQLQRTVSLSGLQLQRPDRGAWLLGRPPPHQGHPVWGLQRSVMELVRPAIPAAEGASSLAEALPRAVATMSSSERCRARAAIIQSWSVPQMR